MRKSLKARRNAFSAVQEILSLFVSVWSSWGVFKDANVDFDNDVKAIDDAELIQKQLIKGYTADKKAKKEVMTEKALSVCGKVAAFAAATGDLVLLGKMKIGQSKLARSSTTLAKQYAEMIYNAAVTVPAADQTAYELSAGIIADLKKAIDAYILVMASPRSQIAIRKYATEQMPLLFKNATDTLNLRLSNLMETYRETNVEFYQQFLNAKIIIDIIKHTTVEGQVVNKETKESLDGVKVIFTSPLKQFEEMTDSQGMYAGSELNPEVEWKVKFILPGYQEKEVDVKDLKRGEHDEINVELVKI